MYSDLVGMIGSLSISESREGSQLGDGLTREKEEQEELRDVLSRLYYVVRPEEEKVRMKVFLWVVSKHKNSIKMFIFNGCHF